VPAIGSQAWSVDRNPKDQSDTTTATASGAASVEGAATVAPAAPLATAASAAPAAAPSPTPLLDQMTRPIFTLRSAAPGTHVMTIHVAPEAIGPVTVRAHIDGGDIRVQVIAPNDESTAALTAILPDLKRDLAQGGMNAALTLHQHTGDFGSDLGNSSGQGARDLFGGSTSQPGGGGPRDQSSPLRLPGDIAQPAASTQAQPRPRTADTSIDVLA
jgi:flagellar hook-length control protein FliK